MKMCSQKGTFLSEPLISDRATEIHPNLTRPAGRRRQGPTRWRAMGATQNSPELFDSPFPTTESEAKAMRR